MTSSRNFSTWLPRAGTFWILTLLLLLVASRLPLIANGYGTDNDSWRNIVAALHMHEAGRYIPSRVPGFPLFEAVMFLLAPGGWIATNLAAIVAGLFAVTVFARLLAQLKQRNPLWPWLAFAFGTQMMVTTSQSMDYAFGMAFFLCAHLAALQRRYLLSGVMLALATACRPSYGPVSLAMFALLLARRENWRAYAAYAVGFIPVVVAFFVPVVTSPDAQGLGGRFAKHADRHMTLAMVPGLVRSSSVFLLGKFGTVVFAVAAMILGVKSFLRRNRESSGNETGPQSVPKEIIVFEVVTVSVITGFYLLIPHTPQYLLPLIPFVLIALARLLPRYLLIAVVIAMIAEPVVSVQLNERRIVAGQLFQEVSRRRAHLDETRALLASNPETPTVYVVGRFNVHRLLVLGPELERTEAGWAAFRHLGIALKSRERHVAFAAGLEAEDRARLADQGWTIQDMKPQK